MEITKRLLDILKITPTNLVCSALIDLTTNRLKFIHGIGYLDIALDDPKNISYITKDREEHFKKVPDSIGVKSIIFTKPTSQDHCPNEELLVTNYYYEKITDIPDRTFYNWVCDRNSGAVWNLRLSDISPKFHFVSNLRKKYAYMSKPIKVVNKLFPENTFDAKSLEEFMLLLYKANTDKLYARKLEFVIVRDKDISKYYSMRTYDKLEGTLGGSCMRKETFGDRFKLYENNNVGMLILRRINTEVIVGRALIWFDVAISDNENLTILDRVYTINHNDVSLFIEFAQNNNWGHKNVQDAHSKDLFRVPSNKYISPTEMDLKIPVKIDFELFPYLDTFSFLNYDMDTLYNFKPSSRIKKFHIYSLTNYETGVLPKVIWSDLSKMFIEETQSIWLDRYNSFVIKNDCVIINGEKYVIDDSDICNTIYSRWALKKDCEYSYINGSFIPKDKALKVLVDTKGREDWSIPEYSVFSNYHGRIILKYGSSYKTYTVKKGPAEYFLQDVPAKVIKNFIDKINNDIPEEKLSTEPTVMEIPPSINMDDIFPWLDSTTIGTYTISTNIPYGTL